MNTPLTWVEIDLRAIAHNIAQLKHRLDTQTRFMAVVKANAYGHGVIEISRCALANGADYLGVARLNEALEIRAAGISAPVLILGHTCPTETAQLVAHDLIQTVYDVETAKAHAHVASQINQSLKVHLKVDSGMGRLGILPSDQAVSDILTISRLPGIDLQGIYSHLATADSRDKTYAIRQYEIFTALLTALKRAGLNVPIIHLANSAGIIDLPATHFNLVRAGIALYGLYPSDEIDRSAISLKPAMSFKTRVIHLKKVGPNFCVSYGCTYKTPAPATIATVAVGYADGYNRLLSSRGHMLVGGKRAPVIGRVCMDQTVIDVSGIPEVEPGSEVVIFGQQEDAVISADELATALNTINYEIVSTITDRVQRCYKV